MIAKNMRELEQMLIEEMALTMLATSKDVLKDMRSETSGYYDGSTPKVYVRTHALENTPHTSPIRREGKALTFDAYLDDTHNNYTSGKQPTMLDVLNLANDGVTNSSVGYLRPTIGNRHFWERALAKMEKTFDKNMRNTF